MPRYIDADELEKNPRFHFPGEIKSEFDYGVKVAREACLDALKYASTADVEPVKHGHWIPDSDDDWYECSSCRCLWVTIHGTPQENNMRFCPECGAKMDGGDE